LRRCHDAVNLAVMLPDMNLRAAVAADRPFLTLMLVEAVNWAPGRGISVAAALADPSLARYVAGWPGPGELGVVAVEASVPIGAAWLRRFDADDPGYGFVAPDIPELSVAVAAYRRRRGVGRAMLANLAVRARAAAIPAISLSVERGNPAAALYREEGYVTAGGDDGAEVMVLRLD
jgi:ribosomal protein S18 acetylase RimI-like enzyme